MMVGATTVSDVRAIDAIAANVSGTRFEDLDPATVRLAKLRVLDVLGCALGGAVAPGNAELLDLFRGWGGREDATVVAHGGRLPAAHAAMVNAILARSNDFEVMSFLHDGELLPSHNASSTVPVALALAEARGLSGRELLAGLVAGDDVVARVSLAADWDFYIGFDGIGSLVPWGTTAVAARLMGLDAQQTAHAFGLMVNLMGGSIQAIWDGAHAFKLVQGTPAKDGIMAAELAERGWTGLDDPFFSRFGYFTMYAKGVKAPEALTDRLGEHYYGESHFKAYPCGLPNHTPITAALALQAEHDLNVDDIASVQIRVVPGWMKNYYAKPFQIRDFPQGDAIFSFRYTTATALVHRAVQVEHFTEEAIRDPQVNALIAKTDVVELPDVPVGSEVVVTMTDGREFRRFEERPTAHPLRASATEEEILEKFRHQVRFTGRVDEAAAERLIELILRLDELDDISEIVRLAAGREAA